MVKDNKSPSIFVIYKEDEISEGKGSDIADADEDPENVETIFGTITNALTSAPLYDPFTCVTLAFSLLNVGLYVFDYVMDCLVVYWLSREDEIDSGWTVWTSVLIVLPLSFVNIFSIVWYHEDHTVHEGGFCPQPTERSMKEKIILILSHITLLGPVTRQFQIISIGLKEKEKYKKQSLEGSTTDSELLQIYMRRKYYERDLAYLNMIDSFTQDAPQLLLQVYILLTVDNDDLQHTETALSQLVSVILSLLSLSQSLVNYSQASRWADPSMPQLSMLSSLSQWLWRLFTLSCRMFVFSVFLTVYTWQFYTFLICHYMLMFSWILAMKTNFCGSMDNKRRPLSEFVYNMVIAAVLIFDIVNVKDGPTRIKNSFYYGLVTLENVGLMVLWWYSDATFIGLHKYVFIIIYVVLQLLGFVLLLFYYKKMHPNKNLPDKLQTAHFL